MSKAKSPFAASNVLSNVQASIKEDANMARQRLAVTKTPRIKDAVKLLSEVLRHATKAHTGPYDLSHTDYINTYAESLDSTIYIDVPSLKDNAPLEALFDWMLAYFDPVRSSDCVTDYSTSRSFDWKAKTDWFIGAPVWRNDVPHLRVEIVCRVAGDSPTCRKVKVGTKLVEQPEYRLECV